MSRDRNAEDEARAFRLRATRDQVAMFLRLAEWPASLRTLAADLGRTEGTVRERLGPLVYTGLVGTSGPAAERVFRLTDEGVRVLAEVRAQEAAAARR